MSKALTGIKDIDFKILMTLKDVELVKVFQVNKYLYQLSFHENFWRERTIKFFITIEGVFKYFEQLDNFRNKRKWKKYYKFLMKTVNSYIKYSIHDIDDTEDQEMIFTTFFNNADVIRRLLKNKNYKAVDKFLNRHFIYSPITNSINIFMEADPEGLEFLLSRSITDYRLVPSVDTFARVFFVNNDNYKILLKYIDINDVFKEILPYHASLILLKDFPYILQQPGIKLETILLLLKNIHIHKEYIDLLKIKAQELSKI